MMKTNVLIGAMALTILVLLVDRISPARAQSSSDMLELLFKVDLMEQNVRTLMIATETANLNVEMNGYKLGDIEGKLVKERRLCYRFFGGDRHQRRSINSWKLSI